MLHGTVSVGVAVVWPFESVAAADVCAADEPRAELSEVAETPGPVDTAAVPLVLLGAEESDRVSRGAVPSTLLDEVEGPRGDVI